MQRLMRVCGPLWVTAERGLRDGAIIHFQGVGTLNPAGRRTQNMNRPHCFSLLMSVDERAGNWVSKCMRMCRHIGPPAQVSLSPAP